MILATLVFIFGMLTGWSATSKSADIIYTDYTAKGFHKKVKQDFISTQKGEKDTYILYYVDGKLLTDKPVGKDYREIKVVVN